MFTEDLIKSIVDKLAESVYPILAGDAIRCFPNEICGFVFEDYTVQPAFNSIKTLNHPALNTTNSFMIDAHAWACAEENKKNAFAIYHSHTNGCGDFSDFDKNTLTLDDVFYIVVGIKDRKLNEIKIHWYENKVLKSYTASLI